MSPHPREKLYRRPPDERRRHDGGTDDEAHPERPGRPPRWADVAQPPGWSDADADRLRPMIGDD